MRRFWRDYIAERQRIRTLRKEQIAASESDQSDRARSTWWNLVLGQYREDRVESVLNGMKLRGEIYAYIRSCPGDFADVVRGIDFFIITISPNRYRTVNLQVTGTFRAEEHRLRHPEVPVITVEPYESKATILDKIRSVIAHVEHG